MIYLAMSPWNGMWKNRHQLMSRFANEMPVLYVEPPQRLRRLRRQLGSAGRSGLRFQDASPEQVLPQLYRFAASDRYPVSGGRGLRYLTERRWHRAIFRAAREIGIERPILWVSLPEQHSAVGRFGEQLSIYHVVDEYAGYTDSQDHGGARHRAEEQDLLDRVDLTIVVSPELVKSKSGPARDVTLVENAVDPEPYSSARADRMPPPDLACLPAPRLGYSGLIGCRLDLKLLVGIATANPDWSIVLIGKIDPRECAAEIRALQAQSNVHFLGEKQPADVASYVANLDVGLLPYAINTETQHISPLKMYEYLAAGLPIVSTDIPAARRKDHVVAVCESSDSFLAACKAAIEGNSAEAVAARIDEASVNTWEHRVEQISTLVRSRVSGQAH